MIEACECRAVLRRASGSTVFVHLVGDRDLIAERMASQSDHFTLVSLLDSHFDELDPLQQDEVRLAIDTELPVVEIVECVISYVGENAEMAS